MDEVKKKFVEYKALDQKIKEMQQQMEMADQQLVEIVATVQSLEEFSKLEDDREILVPVNNGIFARATLKKENKLRVNVGASIIVDKTVEEAKGLIENQKTELQNVRNIIAENIQKLVKRAASLEKELNKLSKNV